VPQVVQDPDEADFVLAHGTEALGGGDAQDPVPCSIAELESLLERCARRTDRRVPLIVANPDFVTVDGRDLRLMPGSLGRFYERLGGQVRDVKVTT
jgi:ribonucleotide monophosphatase NagD (HAD superfamily)